MLYCVGGVCLAAPNLIETACLEPNSEMLQKNVVALMYCVGIIHINKKLANVELAFDL